MLGRANRLLAPRVRRIATGFPDDSRSAPGRPRPHRPYRKPGAAGDPRRRAKRATRRRNAGGPIELLILGGSQGARIMSEVVPPALAALPTRLREMLRVSHQARPEDLPAAEAIYRKNRIRRSCRASFTDVPERLARAHLAICRAGASTVAELAAIGRPAVLIPYPYATDDHQTANARAFAEAGGGWVIAQPELAPGHLSLFTSKICSATRRH